MPTSTDDRRDLMTVIAYMRAQPGKEDELRQALEALIQPTTEEQGYVSYDLQQFAARLDDLLDDGGLTITRLRRIA